MSQPNLAARKAERTLKRARIEKPVVTKKSVPSSPHKVARSKPAVSFSPKDEGKQKATHRHVPKPSSSPALPSSFVVAAGSYEKLLYGLDGTVTSSESGYQIRLKPVFIFPAHVSSIRAVAASPNGGKWLATGSSDEIIKVWDLARRKEIGGLMQHQGMCSFLCGRKPVEITRAQDPSHISNSRRALIYCLRLRTVHCVFSMHEIGRCYVP